MDYEDNYRDIQHDFRHWRDTKVISQGHGKKPLDQLRFSLHMRVIDEVLFWVRGGKWWSRWRGGAEWG